MAPPCPWLALGLLGLVCLGAATPQAPIGEATLAPDGAESLEGHVSPWEVNPMHHGNDDLKESTDEGFLYDEGQESEPNQVLHYEELEGDIVDGDEDDALGTVSADIPWANGTSNTSLNGTRWRWANGTGNETNTTIPSTPLLPRPTSVRTNYSTANTTNDTVPIIVWEPNVTLSALSNQTPISVDWSQVATEGEGLPSLPETIRKRKRATPYHPPTAAPAWDKTTNKDKVTGYVSRVAHQPSSSEACTIPHHVRNAPVNNASIPFAFLFSKDEIPQLDAVIGMDKPQEGSGLVTSRLHDAFGWIMENPMRLTDILRPGENRSVADGLSEEHTCATACRCPGTRVNGTTVRSWFSTNETGMEALTSFGKFCGADFTGCNGEAPCDETDGCCLQHRNCLSEAGSEGASPASCHCHAQLATCVLRAKESPVWCTKAAGVVRHVIGRDMCHTLKIVCGDVKRPEAPSLSIIPEQCEMFCPHCGGQHRPLYHEEYESHEMAEQATPPFTFETPTEKGV